MKPLARTFIGLAGVTVVAAVAAMVILLIAGQADRQETMTSTVEPPATAASDAEPQESSSVAAAPDEAPAAAAADAAVDEAPKTSAVEGPTLIGRDAIGRLARATDPEVRLEPWQRMRMLEFRFEVAKLAETQIAAVERTPGADTVVAEHAEHLRQQLDQQHHDLALAVLTPQQLRYLEEHPVRAFDTSEDAEDSGPAGGSIGKPVVGERSPAAPQ